MSLPNELDNRKEVGLYCYSAETNGDIELSFNISEPGDYKLVITPKLIKRMSDTSEMMIKADNLGYFNK